MTVSDPVITNQFAISNFGEYYLPSINRDTFELLDSNTAFKQKFKSCIFKEDTLHIVIGLDSGLLANYILNQKVPSGSKYIFIELAEVLQLLNVEIDANQEKTIKIVEQNAFEQELNSSENDLYLVKDKVLIHQSFASASGILEQYSSMVNLVQKQLSLQTFDRKSYFQQKHFLVQQLKNLPDNVYPASILNNKFSGKSCIIIGGGPSLDSQIEWIKQNYKALFIITVSRMAFRLSKEGIPAHIIVSIDPQDCSFEVNREMMGLFNESLFINAHHVNHRILSQWQGKSLFLGARLPWFKEDFDNIVTVGPTVTNSAVRIAIELGFKTILLTGADFCFSSDGSSHASGTVEAKSGPNNSLIGEWVETYAGNIAETPIQLAFAAQALSQEAIQHPDVNMINLSEDAAKLEGISYQPTSTIKLIPANISPVELLALVPDTAAEKNKYLNKMRLDLEASVVDLKNIKELSQQAIRLNLQAEKLDLHTKKNKANIAKLDAIEKMLQTKYAELSQVIKFYGYYEFSKFMTTKESNAWSVEHMQNMTHLYYKAFETLAIELSGSLEDTIKLIKVRQNELADTLGLKALAKQWIESNQPGRIFVVEQLRNKLNLPYNSHSPELVEVIAEYQSQLTSKEHAYFSLKKWHTSLHNTFAKITGLYKTKNKIGLNQVITNIEHMIEDALAQRLYYLAQSYLAILNDDNQTALSCLQAIEPDNQTEVEKKQILLLALKLHYIDLAEQTLEQMINYSDEYLPQYAHVLTLQGKNQQALNAYLDYLDKYPTDISVLLKLGVFLAEMGQIDGARSSFEQVLIIDPDNLTAPNYLQQLQA
ncbi:motility associated factor glycosyltransferase family protein [Shewanella halifaxensis]|uniref:motility associated factor glycosyltransferase family protein n=1 Tax=Shewanella halifaxensis TaxID=271098 RepID=UPI000D599DBE|nr:6-hydroxymethylpterin diphosphokinase MptE-like protein [Shewanella halifaxensis]